MEREFKKNPTLLLSGEFIANKEGVEDVVTGLQTCIAVALYNEKEKLVGVGHFDGVNCVKDGVTGMIGEINGAKKIKNEEISALIIGGDFTSKSIKNEILRVLDLYNIKKIDHERSTDKAKDQTITVLFKNQKKKGVEIIEGEREMVNNTRPQVLEMKANEGKKKRLDFANNVRQNADPRRVFSMQNINKPLQDLDLRR